MTDESHTSEPADSARPGPASVGPESSSPGSADPGPGNSGPGNPGPDVGDPGADEPSTDKPGADEAANSGSTTEPDPVVTIADAEVRIRRAPKYPTFLILGGGFGAIVTFILTASFPADPAIGFGPIFGYFLIYGIPAGIVLGAIVALILDRVSSRRAKEVTVAHTTVDPLPAEDDPAD